MSIGRAFLSLLTVLLIAPHALALIVRDVSQGGDFPLVAGKHAATIVFDANDHRVVAIAANCLADDIERVSGVRPKIEHALSPGCIVIGSLDRSSLVGDHPAVRTQWETFEISAKDGHLTIAGSDRRGTAFGVFELSRAIGVSPWNWWADVPARHRDALFVAPDDVRQGPPSVKYRGVFLNDEDWGLAPWAAKTFEPEARGPGPKTYAKLFELLLRLKANYCWPAMHPCSPAFNSIPANKQVADDYAIVMGSSHCEQMLCNNVTEWPKAEKEKWNPVTNLPAIVDYWEKRVISNAKFESTWTVGMRGIHDGAMPGGGTLDEKRDRLEHIIDLQRGLLAKHVNADVEKVPQIFCPYKEVLDIYRDGMKLPDDITIVWPDDNYGYIRQLPDSREKKRAGGSGIYYHLSYNGKPHDYLWLESIAPALIWEEMSKAYDCGASRLWVVNVGDLKPIEAGTTLFLELGWNIHAYGPNVQQKFLHDFYAEQFGAEHADAITEVMCEYFRLASIRKPETMGFNTTYPTTKVGDSDWSAGERKKRIADYLSLNLRAHGVQVLAEARAAYFELVLYPITAAEAMNVKMISAEESRSCAAAGQTEAANRFADRSEAAAAQIERLTEQYNSQLNGRWRGMMDCHPRKLPVFDKPNVARLPGPDGTHPTTAVTKAMTTTTEPAEAGQDNAVLLDAVRFSRLIDGRDGLSHWTAVEGLGRRGGALILLPRTGSTAKSLKDAPVAEYSFHVGHGGEMDVIVEALPTQPIDSEHELTVALAVDDGSPIAAKVEQENDENSKLWQANTLRNAAFARLRLNIPAGDHTLKLFGADPSVGVQRITVGH